MTPLLNHSYSFPPPGSVKSNPPVQEIQWTFEKEPLTFDKSQGILSINHTLILQQVKKERRGHYACIARNSLGESTSQPFFLKIKCKCLLSKFDDVYYVVSTVSTGVRGHNVINYPLDTVQFHERILLKFREDSVKFLIFNFPSNVSSL